MIASWSAKAARPIAPVGRHAAAQGPMAPARGAVCARAQNEGFFSDAFKAALANAMERDQTAAAGLYSDAYNSSSRDYGYSRSEGGYDNGYNSSSTNSRWSRASSSHSEPSQSAASAGPLLQILATALGQSRATLERLQTEEAEIENLIQRERKQVERLEWLLEKVQQDYAYFDSLQRRFEHETNSNSNNNRGGYY